MQTVEVSLSKYNKAWVIETVLRPSEVSKLFFVIFYVCMHTCNYNIHRGLVVSEDRFCVAEKVKCIKSHIEEISRANYESSVWRGLSSFNLVEEVTLAIRGQTGNACASPYILFAILVEVVVLELEKIE